MTDMYFDGTIIKADLHAKDAPLESFIELRIIIDVEEEIMIEVTGTAPGLAEKFGLEQTSFEKGNIGLVGKKCQVLRNGAGYHFIGMQQ